MTLFDLGLNRRTRRQRRGAEPILQEGLSTTPDWRWLSARPTTRGIPRCGSSARGSSWSGRTCSIRLPPSCAIWYPVVAGCPLLHPRGSRPELYHVAPFGARRRAVARWSIDGRHSSPPLLGADAPSSMMSPPLGAQRSSGGGLRAGGSFLGADAPSSMMSPPLGAQKSSGGGVLVAA